MTRRTSVLAVVAVLAAALLSACGVGLPDQGPVVESTATGTNPREDAGIINPRHPGEGDTPEEIVRGFIDAMQATPPISTAVAREFLTPEASESWEPQGIVAYSTALISSTRGTDDVTMTLDDAVQTDERGAWLGPVSDGATWRVPVEQQDDGEWRITDPPEHIMVPRSWFEGRLRQANLYFFDSSASVLVPEPVFVPRGLQFASTLVNGLLQGPSTALATSQRSFLPSGMRPVVSVPVDGDGLATVALTSDSEDVVVAPPEAARLVAQLAWTLRQDLSILRFTLSVGGRDVKLPTGESQFSVGSGDSFAPYVSDASTQLFGLAGGRLVSGEPDSLEPVAGPFGQEDYGLGSVAVSLAADEAAGVSTDGSTLWRGAVDDEGDSPTVLLGDGVDLLDPAWDFRGRLWAVDRRPEGSVVWYGRGANLRRLEVPGISGQDVKDFLVSRDGSRLVAVVRRDVDNDAVVVSRVVTTGDGQVVMAQPAVGITSPDTAQGRIRDIEWRSPTSVAFLQPISQRNFQVRSASVDGATLGVESILLTVADALTLVGTPAPRQPLYALTREGLLDLAESADRQLPVPPEVTALTYVG